MIAKLRRVLSLLGRARKEILVLAAVVGAVASSHELHGQVQHYAVQAAAVLGALSLFVRNLPNPTPESKAAPPSTPASPERPVTPAPPVEQPPLIPPPH